MGVKGGQCKSPLPPVESVTSLRKVSLLRFVPADVELLNMAGVDTDMLSGLP
jgi:hypothetical protein